MKYLILCPFDKRIIFISKTINYDAFGNILLDTGIYVAKGIADIVEVNDIPGFVEEEKYCYIDGEYVEYIEPVFEIVEDEKEQQEQQQEQEV